jgi:hypothetical protein
VICIVIVFTATLGLSENITPEKIYSDLKSEDLKWLNKSIEKLKKAIRTVSIV